METQSPFEQFNELKVDQASKTFLAETAKWTSFLAILGFIGIGLMVLASLLFIVMGSSMSSMSPSMSMMPGGPAIIGIVYLIFAGFYFLPISYLYKFSTNMKHAIASNNQASLTNAFEYLKSHYKFIGILTIVVISLYILLIVVMMIG